MFLRLAILYVIKHRRRSALIVFCVFLSVFILLTLGGLMNGMKASFFNEIADSGGHIQIHSTGWQESLSPYPLDRLIGKADDRVTALRSREGVRSAEALLLFGALAVRGEKNLAVACAGLDPSSRYWLDARSGPDGSVLPLENDEVLLSRTVASLLGLAQGETVQLLCEDSGGTPAYRDYRVKALYFTGKPEVDDSWVFMNRTEAADLLWTGDGASEIRVTLEDRAGAEAFAPRLVADYPPDRFETRTWEEINGSLAVFIKMFDLSMLMIDFMIAIVVGSVLTNAVLMTMLGRVREFGTLRAIGLKRGQLFSMILTEGTLLGLAGSLAGLAAGIPVVLYYARVGLDIGPLAEILGTSSTYRFALNPATAGGNALAGLVISIAAYLFAAWVSSRRGIIDALASS